MPKINAAGLALIKSFEGCVLYVYDDADKHDPHPIVMPGQAVVGTLTVGFGHTGDDVKPGLTITQAHADALLAADLAKFESGVNNMLARSINSNEFSAMVSFAFNVGLGALQSSTLLRLVNLGEMTQAADQFHQWVNAGGNVLPGLVRRRAAERALFLTP